MFWATAKFYSSVFILFIYAAHLVSDEPCKFKIVVLMVLKVLWVHSGLVGILLGEGRAQNLPHLG